MEITVNEKHQDVIDYRAAAAKLRQLQADRGKRQRDIEDIRARQAELQIFAAQDRLAAEAEELLAGAVPKGLDSPEIAELQHIVDVLGIAIAKQRQIVDLAAGHFSRAVCAINRAQYVDIERRIAKAVQALALANEAEARFFDALRDAGCVSINFRPMRVNEVGLAFDPNSRAAMHKRELKEFLPEAL